MARAQREDPPLVGELRKAIETSGRSLSELGRVSGVNNSQLSRFMRGERSLTVAAAGRICEALDLHLVSGTKPKRQRPANT